MKLAVSAVASVSQTLILALPDYIMVDGYFMKFLKKFQNSLSIYIFIFQGSLPSFSTLIEVFACCHGNQVSWSSTSIFFI